MPVESATYISDLVPANPTSGDPASQGDDHLRLIKSVLKTTFPNLTGAAPGVTAGIGIPAGVICYWYGSVGSIPSGWALANGATYSKLDGSGSIVAPSLINVFAYGTDGVTAPAHAPGSFGGALSNTPTITINGHTLTQGELPNYNLSVSDPTHTHGASTVSSMGATVVVSANEAFNNTASSGGDYVFNVNTGTVTINSATTIANAATGISVNSAGSNAAHSHTATSSLIPTLPPWIALVPIMKL